VSKGPRRDLPPGITPIYEGPEVLDALLAKAGSPFDVEEVAQRFTEAVAADERRSTVIPSLFEDEPHFASPEDARRLYANLFGLWARVVSGRGLHDDDAPEAAPEPAAPPPLRERGTCAGSSPPADVVEAMWRQLAAAPERELRRLHDRFTNAQPELGAWVDELALNDAALAAVHDLAFETWVIFDHCFGDRLGVAEWSELRALEREPPAVEVDHPALATYVSEQLDNLSDEDANFSASDRAQVERALAAVTAALSAAVREPS
jgi:hypothetical protein